MRKLLLGLLALLIVAAAAGAIYWQRGAALMRASLEGARSAGFSRVLLGVFGRNEAAIGFYRRQGFVLAGERKFQVGASVYDDFVLARPL